MRKRKKWLSVVLSMCMIITTLVPSISFAGPGAGGDGYIDIKYNIEDSANKIIRLDIKGYSAPANTWSLYMNYNKNELDLYKKTATAGVITTDGNIKQAVVGALVGNELITKPVTAIGYSNLNANAELDINTWGWAKYPAYPIGSLSEGYIKIDYATNTDDVTIATNYGFDGSNNMTAPETGLPLFSIYFKVKEGVSLNEIDYSDFSLKTGDITVGTGARIAAGATVLTEEAKWNGFPDYTAPTAGLLSPTGSAVVVEDEEAIVLGFSEEVTAGTEMVIISEGGINFYGSIPDAEMITSSGLQWQAIMPISSFHSQASATLALDYSKTYTVTVSGGAFVDTSDNLIEGAELGSFTTAANNRAPSIPDAQQTKAFDKYSPNVVVSVGGISLGAGALGATTITAISSGGVPLTEGIGNDYTLQPMADKLALVIYPSYLSARPNGTTVISVVFDSTPVVTEDISITIADTTPALSTLRSVSIAGTAKFNENLTATLDGVGGEKGTLSYQWYRGATQIGGAVNTTYTTVEADVGSPISVAVSSTIETGFITSAGITIERADTSAPNAPVASNIGTDTVTLTTISGAEYSKTGAPAAEEWQVSPVFTGLTPNQSYNFYARYMATTTHAISAASAPLIVTTSAISIYGPINISGAAVYNQALTAVGLTPAAATVNYQWYRGETVDLQSTLISGATSATYTIVQDDIGKYLKIAILGTGQYQSNVPLTTVSGLVAKAAAPSAPSVPVLSGAALYNAIDLVPIASAEYRASGAGISAAWQSSNLFTGLLPNETYEFYARIAETVTQLPSTESPALVASTPKQGIGGTAAIVGTLKFGEMLTANLTNVTPVGAQNTLIVTWKRGDTDIATGTTYTAVQADIGNLISISATPGAGDDYTGTVTVAAIGLIEKAAGPAAPTGLTGITPTESIYSDGKITGLNSAVSYEYKISGAAIYTTVTAASIELSPLASGTYLIRIPATATNTAGSDATVTVSPGPVKHNLSYDGNGKTAGTMDATSRQIDGVQITAATMPADLAKTGYTFTGWNTAANGTGTAVSAGGTFVMPSADTTLFAQWAAIPVAFTNQTLTSGEVGTAYSTQFSPATAGSGTFSYALKAGSTLPAGLSFDGLTRTISGTPTTKVTAHTFTIVATDSINATTAEGVMTISISNTLPIIVSAPTGSNIAFGQQLTSSTLSGGEARNKVGAIVGGTFAWTAPTTTAAAVGAQSYSVTFTPTDSGNYDSTTTNAAVTVVKASPQTVIWPSASAITYGSIIAGTSTLSGGSAKGYLNADIPGTFSWTSGTLTASAIGTQTAEVAFTPDNATNFNATTGSISVTVNKADPIVTWSSAATITYGALLNTSVLSGGSATGIASESVDGVFAWVSGSTKPNAGTTSYDVTFTPSGAYAAHYNVLTNAVNITVNKAIPTITTLPTAANAVYGVALSGVALSGGQAKVDGTAIGGTFAWQNTATVPTVGDATGYNVVFTPTDSVNYTTASGIVLVTVSKATPTVSVKPTANSINYGQTLINSTFNGGSVLNSSSVSVPGAFSWADTGIAPNTGTTNYTVYYTPTDLTNYTTTSAIVAITVNKANTTISVAPTASAITFGQAISASTFVSGTAISAVTGNNVAGSFSWINSATKPGSAGVKTYSIKFVPTDKVNYNESATINIPITVNKALAPAITWPVATAINYGDTLSASTLTGGSTAEGTFNWQSPATVLDVSATGAAVVFTPFNTADYDYSTVTLNKTIPITVAQKAISGSITIMSADATPVLGTVLTADISNLAPSAASATIQYQWKNDGTNVGTNTNTYTIASGTDKITVTVSGQGNYTGSLTSAIVEAGKTQFTGTVTLSANKTVGDELTATVTGTPATTLTYVWKSGTTLLASTTSKCAISATDVGKVISVEVKGDSATYTGAISDSTDVIIKKTQAAPGSAPSLAAGGQSYETLTIQTITGQQYGISTTNDASTVLQWITGTGTDKIFSSLDAGTTYYVFTRLPESADSNASNASSALTQATLPAAAPSAPSGVTATAGNTTLTINWTASSANGSPIISYMVSVQKGTDAAITYGTVGTSYSVTGLVNGSAYKITVTATNEIGSTASSEITGTPVAPTGGGGGGGTTTVVPPSVDTTTTTGTTTTTTTQTQSTTSTPGTATASIPTSQITSAVATAVSEAAKGGTEPVVLINVAPPVQTAGTTATTAIVTSIPQSAIQQLADSTVTSLVIATPVGEITFSEEIIAALAQQGSIGDLVISVEENTAVTNEDTQSTDMTSTARFLIGDRPVFDINISINGTRVSSFGGSSLQLMIPYTMQPGESADQLAVYHLINGQAVRMADSQYHEDTGMFSFSTAHLSSFAVGTATSGTARFTDVPDSEWYATYVYYLADRGIINGTTATTYEPLKEMTRAEFASLMAKMSGADLTKYTEATFTDVASSQWFFGAVAWAAENKIVLGWDGNFNPNGKITRQDIATMIERYATNVAGKQLTGTITPATFIDQQEIADYAKPAVLKLQQAGIIAGKPDNSFAPADTATRAEVAKMAAVLHQLI